MCYDLEVFSQRMDFINQLNIAGACYLVGDSVRNLLFNTIHQRTYQIAKFDLAICGVDSNVVKMLFFISDQRNKVENDLFIAYHKDIKFILKISLIKSDSIIDFLKYNSVASINAISIRIVSYVQMFNLTNHFSEDHLCDPHSGYSDIKDFRYRIIGDIDRKFQSDPLLILTSIRQAAEFGMFFDKNTHESIIKNKDLLKTIPPESLFKELILLLNSNNQLFINFLFIYNINEIFEFPYQEIIDLSNYPLEEKLKILSDDNLTDWNKKFLPKICLG